MRSWKTLVSHDSHYQNYWVNKKDMLCELKFFPLRVENFSGHTLRWSNHLSTWKINPAFVENTGWSLKLELSKVLQRTLVARFANQFPSQNTLSRTPCCVFIQSDKRDCVCVRRYFLSRRCFHFNPLSSAKKIIGRNFQLSAGARIVREHNFY